MNEVVRLSEAQIHEALAPNENGVIFETSLHKDRPEQGDICKWHHLCAHNPKTREWLESDLKLDQNVVDAMLANGTRPRILVRKDGVMINIRGINFDNPDEPEDMISLRIWIDDQRIVTCRRRDLRSVTEVIQQFKNGDGPSTAGQFLTSITTLVFDRIEPFIEQLETCVLRLESEFDGDSDDDVSEDAAMVRRRCTIYRRHIKPQKEILKKLQSRKPLWLEEDDKEELVESHDQVIRYTEILDDLRERTTILNEEMRSQQADRLNRMAYLFSVAATIFLPLGFLTGLMGINAGGIPGEKYSGGFWIFLVVCAVLVFLQVVYFRKKRWF